jgi:hypothetical protein
MMFDNNEKDLQATLKLMYAEARDRSDFNQIEADQKLRTWLANDSRFANYDSGKLVEHLKEHVGHGAKLQLDEPKLMKSPPRNRYS